MEQHENPYAPPQATFEIVPSSDPRRINTATVAIAGATIGATSFLVAMFFVPTGVESLSQHDLRLANNIGFIFPPTVALWAAWIRRSIIWAVLGVGIGLLIGFAYYLLCGYNFLAVMVAFPCVLGGCASVLLGIKHDSLFNDIPKRFVRGLLAGLALGVSYAILLNVFGLLFLPSFRPDVPEYSSMMWRAGTIAMALSSGIYFLLFHWSASIHGAIAR